MTSQSGIGLVVFDWAGTAVDFGCVGPALAFAESFAEAGVPATMVEVRAFMGLAKKEHIRRMLAEPALAARWHAARGRLPTESDVESLYRAVTPRQVEAAGRRGTPVPGLLECVAELRAAGVKIAGTTGYFREAADAAAQSAARHGYAPDASVCSDDVTGGRPAPWMLFRAMEATGVYPAWRAVKVGDTEADVGEGRGAGAWCVGVIDSSNGMGLSESEFAALPGPERDERRRAVAAGFVAAGAHAVVNTPRELPALVGALDARLARGERP